MVVEVELKPSRKWSTCEPKHEVRNEKIATLETRCRTHNGSATKQHSVLVTFSKEMELIEIKFNVTHRSNHILTC